MSKFEGRNKTALLVIDVQKGVIDGLWNSDVVVANINQLVAAAREAGTPVVWVQHSEEEMPIGSEPWMFMPNLVAPNADEDIVQKNYRSSFEETDLDDVLEKLGAGHLIITGAETNNCIRHTTHAAMERGYDLTLIADAHTGWDYDGAPAASIIAEQNASLNDYQLPGRTVNVQSTEQVVF